MKATGVVRRIDDLGRIVLPKELRRTMRIKEGESLEIYTDGDNKIVLKKYSPVNQMTDFVKEFTDSIYTTSKKNIIITDNEQIVAASGNFKYDLVGKKITKELENHLKNRNTHIKNNGDELNVCDSYTTKNASIIKPINVFGDIMIFKVLIKETLEKVVKVEANNKHEALLIADKNYRKTNDDYILSADNFTDIEFKVLEDD